MKKFVYLIISLISITVVFLLNISEKESNHSFQESLISDNELFGNIEKDGVLARVANKIIYLDEFYKRAEYTIRPSYCRNNYNIEKMIILNSLIGEKLLALEYENKPSIKENVHFKRYIQGRREQAMRQVLFLKNGYEKVALDSAEIVTKYRVAGRKYNVEYFTVKNEEVSKNVEMLLFDKKERFSNVYTAYTKVENISTKEIGYFSDELPEIQSAIFADTLSRDQIIGPVIINDSTRLFMKVKGWNDKLVFDQIGIKQRLNDVKQKLSDEKADKIYSEYIARVMKGKRLDFNKEIFYKLVNILGPIYLKKEKAKVDRFLESTLNKPNEIPKIEDFGNGIEQIIDEPLFKLNENTWTVGDLQEYLEIHPFVFRKKNIGNREFAGQLQYAIIDLIQDKYLTEEAYNADLDKDFRVEQYENIFRDANIGIHGKYLYLESQDIGGQNWLEIVENILTPYIKELQQKYSSSIEINIAEFNKIRLTNIDLFATQRGVPFPIVVPGFPLITTSHHLDYGKIIVGN